MLDQTPADKLDQIPLWKLRESPALVEAAIRETQALAANDESARSLLHSIFLGADRDAEFTRYRKTRDFAASMRLLKLFDVKPIDRIVEVGAGSCFFSWSLSSAGFNIEVVEPSGEHVTGTGYLRSRSDADQVRIHNDLDVWLSENGQYDVLITKNCLHHFRPIGFGLASLRRRLKNEGLFFSFREYYADNAREVAEAVGGHPLAVRYGLYEWPYPAHHYVESAELAGFELIGIVPDGYDGNCLAGFNELGDPDPAGTEKFDRHLARQPQETVIAFWEEVKRNRFEGGCERKYTRPQVMIFRKVAISP
jgi:SAM-dependent methyltransferase